MTKTCPKCHLTYADAHKAFYKRASHSDGLQASCKTCAKSDSQEKYWDSRGGVENRQRAERTARPPADFAQYKPLSITKKARRMKDRLEEARLLIRRD